MVRSRRAKLPQVKTPPLLGREDELSFVTACLEATTGGAGGVVVMEGPAGIGKSRILGELGARATEWGFVVAMARSEELDQVTPLGPLITALRAGDRPILTTSDLDMLDLADQRLWILDRLRAILEAESRRHPVLIAIDDIQWADSATLHAIATLPRQLFSVPVLWALARRPAPSTAAMQTTLSRLADLGARRLRIEPLAPDAVPALTRASIGAAPDPQLTEMLQDAAGNPFYMLEVLRGLSAAGRIVHRNGVAQLVPGELPASFRMAVSTHTRGMDATARRVVEVASVFGRECAVADLATVMNVRPVELADPISDVLAADLLVEHGDALAFRHDLVRHAVYDGLPAPLRQALHGEVAAALRAGGASVSHVATHVSLSARAGDEVAIATLTQAASALASTNPAAAADLATRALGLLPEGDPRRADAATFAVDLLGQAARLEDARAVARAVLSETTVDSVRQAVIHLGIRRSWVMTTRNPIDWPVPAEVWADPALSHELRAMLLALEAAAGVHADLAGSERIVQRARRESAASGNADAEMLVAVVSASVSFARGRLDVALEFAREADSLRARGSFGSQSFPCWFVAFCLCPLDALREAEQLFTVAYRAGEHAGAPFDMSLAEASRAAALLALGRLDDAATTAESAAEIAAPLGLGQPLGEALRVGAEVHIRRGDLAAAKTVVRRLEPLLESGAATATASWALALLAEAQGDRRRALDALAEPIGMLVDRHYRIGVPDPPQLAHLVRVALEVDDIKTATLASEAAEYLSEANGRKPSLAGVAAHARGLVERDEDDLRRAVAQLETGQRPLATAAVNEDLGALLTGRGRTQEAVDLLMSAHRTYSSCGADLDAARVRSHLRQLGVRARRSVSRRPSQGWDSLTPSELSVCRSVADGLSSNDVAARLYLSVNTVNTHLRHAFIKLGIRSRVELTRVVMQHDAGESS